MRTFEGTLRVRFDAESNRVFLDRGIAGSTLTAADADKIAQVAIEAAIKNKAGLDRWSFYVKDASEKLPKDPKAKLDPKEAQKALKAGFKANVVLAKFGKPALWIVPEVQKQAKVSKFTDLA
jgi:hypothetical protein